MNYGTPLGNRPAPNRPSEGRLAPHYMMISATLGMAQMARPDITKIISQRDMRVQMAFIFTGHRPDSDKGIWRFAANPHIHTIYTK